MKKFKSIRIITLMGLFLALDIILNNVLLYKVGSTKISLGLLPKALCGAFLGPAAGGILGILSDTIGFHAFPQGATYSPLYPITYVIEGILFGLFLYKKDLKIIRVIIAVVIVTFFCETLLTSLWHTINFAKNSYWGYVITRLPLQLLFIPIYSILIFGIQKALTPVVGNFLKKAG